MTQILFKKRLPNAQVPVRGTEHAAAFDLVAASIDRRHLNKIVVDTGLNIAFPPGHVLYLHSRSGHGMKYNIRLTNGTGVIDADYRGPLMLMLTQDSEDKYGDNIGSVVKVGDRVGQAILVKLPDVEWVEVDELPESVRGENGFGSTGVR